MTKKNSFSKLEMMDILKRLIRKYSTSRFSKSEMADILKRLINKYSTKDGIKAPQDLSNEHKK